MACMCGDTMCPSCGPAQGYDPDFETACEWLEHSLFADLPTFGFTDVDVDVDDPDEQNHLYWGRVAENELAEEIGNRIGQRCSQEFVDACVREARRWQREQAKK